ncbi:restriction endonuclease [Acinetobacter johnsonii]|uniref:restriction endonuclease n=1 Tax=Acinetobacter johnsonii TaxID=40214 RepID=UPI002449915B|nr:restriction endonuclease [Acinetobacter johnsonii]MDH1068957.1 restriction endonuclease [Acinetobacter johnsonii]
MGKNTGRGYEEFVHSLYKAILKSDELGLGPQKNINVEINKKLASTNGIERQFDIYWEYALGGITYKSVIECKDYNSKISIEKIDALQGKLNDFPNLRGIFATKKGYQSGAEIKAKERDIELLIVREQNDSDWTDINGQPLLREIHIQMNGILPASILEFEPKLPQGEILPAVNAATNEIVINNNDTGESYTVYELQQTLMQGHSEVEGDFEKELLFNGKVTTPTHVINIVGYRVKYRIHKPVKSDLIIDFSEKLLGVVEFLNQGRKAKIYADFISVLEN